MRAPISASCGGISRRIRHITRGASSTRFFRRWRNSPSIPASDAKFRKPRDDVRELIFQHYRIIYVIKPNCVFIASIIHGSRDLSRQATKPWEVG